MRQTRGMEPKIEWFVVRRTMSEPLRVAAIQQQSKICRLVCVKRQLAAVNVPQFCHYNSGGLNSSLGRTVKLSGLEVGAHRSAMPLFDLTQHLCTRLTFSCLDCFAKSRIGLLLWTF